MTRFKRDQAIAEYPFCSAGQMLHSLGQRFPRFVFTSGLDMKTRRYCVFVHDKVVKGTNIPAAGSEIARIETEGGSEEAYNLLCTKIVMMHG